MSKNIRRILPWYLNNTLSAQERQRAESAILQDKPAQAELAAWKQVQAALNAQPQETAGPQVRQQLMVRIQSYRPAVLVQHQWLWRSVSYTAMLLSIFLLLWLVVQPGVVLEWSGGQGVDMFRVYRANTHNSEYSLIGEFTAQPGTTHYNYIDAWLLPGQKVTYWVEGVAANEQAALSQVVSVDSLSALPGQIALLISSGILAGVLLMMIQNINRFKFRRNALA